MGNMGVKLSKVRRPRAASGSMALTATTRTSPKYLSPSLGGRTWPVTWSPVLSPNRLIWDWETYTSLAPCWLLFCLRKP